MNTSTRQNLWTTHDAVHLYGLDRWGRGFFNVNEHGNIAVKTEAANGQSVQYDLNQVVESAAGQESVPPLIVRFPGIIRQRIRQISNAFDNAIAEFEYEGHYHCIYPIKVNQHAEVVESVLQAQQQHSVGLESGSKAELLAVIARAENNTPVLCNGFKDSAIIEMAFLACAAGRNITIVIEKPSDVELIIEVSKQFTCRPRIGVRTKLGWKGAGHWSSTAGIKSKFGLNSTELLDCVNRLREHDLLQHLQLLHFHPGSQINDVRLIKSALIEATRVFADMVLDGVPLDTIDVGGGLAIDYTGNQNNQPSSMNYTLQEYANDVVYYIQMVCQQAGISHPNIYSESGRAVVAHHSILVVPVFATSERPKDSLKLGEQETKDAYDPNLQPLSQLREILVDVENRIAAGSANLDARVFSEAYHDAQQSLEMALQLFVNGHLTLRQRSLAERIYWRICYQIREVLNRLDFVPEDLKELRDHLADTYFCNFSVFQSLPDFWALEHLFPIVPIHRLDERPRQRGVIGDITCDSDGKIDKFLSGTSGKTNSLPMHEFNSGQNYYLGIFLVGAYQEALSDDHNLLGKFNTVIVDSQSSDSQPQLKLLPGSDLREVIEHVNHNWSDLVRRFADVCDAQLVDGIGNASNIRKAKEFFESLSRHYTYLSQVSFSQIGKVNEVTQEAISEPEPVEEGSHPCPVR